MKRGLTTWLLVSAALLAVQASEAASIRLGGQCNLARAIQAANLDRPVLGCPAGRGADSIVMRPDSVITLHTRRLNQGPLVYAGLPAVRSKITIAGRGSTITRSFSRQYFGLLHVVPGADLTLINITLTRARSGAVFNQGTLTVRRSTLTENDGAIFNHGALTIINSTFSRNYSDTAGAIESNGEVIIRISDSTLINNAGTFPDHTILIASPGLLIIKRSLIGGYINPDAIYHEGTTIIDNSIIASDDGSIIGNQGGVKRYYGSLDTYVTLPDQRADELVDLTLIKATGQTPVHLLPAGSQAIDGITDGTCTSTIDQRGVARPQDGNLDGGPACDIGAVEYVPPTP